MRGGGAPRASRRSPPAAQQPSWEAEHPGCVLPRPPARPPAAEVRTPHELQARPQTAPAHGEAAGSSGRGREAGSAPPSSPSARPGTAGFLRGGGAATARPSTAQGQQSLGLFCGLARRPGSPGAAGGGGSPPPLAFEVRGASLLGGAESPRPSTPKPGFASPARDGYGGSAGAFSVHARAGAGGYAAQRASTSSGGSEAGPACGRAGSGGSPATARSVRQAQQPGAVSPADAAAAAVVAHHAAVTAGRRQASPQHQQHQRVQLQAAGGGSSSSAGSSARSSVSGADSGPAPYTTYHVPGSLAGQGNSSTAAVPGGQPAPAAAAPARPGSSLAASAPFSHHLVHSNPLFSDGSSTLAGRALPGTAAQQQQQQQQWEQALSLEAAMAGLTVATRAPPSPKAPSSGGPASAAGTPSATLQVGGAAAVERGRRGLLQCCPTACSACLLRPPASLPSAATSTPSSPFAPLHHRSRLLPAGGLQPDGGERLAPHQPRPLPLRLCQLRCRRRLGQPPSQPALLRPAAHAWLVCDGAGCGGGGGGGAW